MRNPIIVDSADSRRYLWLLGATIFTAILSVIALVVVIDPYGIYQVTPARAGLNWVKPNPTRYQNEIKLTHVVALKPDVLIFGNSRAEIGFNPEGSLLSNGNALAYNLAIPGTSIATAYEQLAYLLRIGQKPKLIVIGLEFLDFVDPPGVTPIAAVVPNLPQQHPIEKRFWQFDSLFSFTSLKDALRTVAIQLEKSPETITSRGFNPLKQYRLHAQAEGYYALFSHKARENAKVYLRKAGGSLNGADFGRLSAMIELAQRSDIQTKIVIYPYHAQILTLFELTGLWPFFEDWKQRVIRDVDAIKRPSPEAGVELFDFSGYSTYACERIPDKGDRKTETRWYWEGGHFKKALGEKILERILAEPSAGPKEDPEFGVELESGNWAVNQRRIVAERARCLEANPALFDDSAKLVAALRKR